MADTNQPQHQKGLQNRPGKPGIEQWLASITCQINLDAAEQLFRDEPGKRRRIYLEFKHGNPTQIVLGLGMAGFDLSSLRRLRYPASCMTSTLQYCFSCLITGTSENIVKFLYRNPQVHRASIDLPEYSWLSVSPERLPLPESADPASV